MFGPLDALLILSAIFTVIENTRWASSRDPWWYRWFIGGGAFSNAKFIFLLLLFIRIAVWKFETWTPGA